MLQLAVRSCVYVSHLLPCAVCGVLINVQEVNDGTTMNDEEWGVMQLCQCLTNMQASHQSANALLKLLHDERFPQCIRTLPKSFEAMQALMHAKVQQISNVESTLKTHTLSLEELGMEGMGPQGVQQEEIHFYTADIRHGIIVALQNCNSATFAKRFTPEHVEVDGHLERYTLYMCALLSGHIMMISACSAQLLQVPIGLHTLTDNVLHAAALLLFCC